MARFYTAYMKLIFLYGMPASGKLTVARALAERTGLRLFHNHLAVDLLLSVFEFGSPAFVALREEIWLSVFREACRSGSSGLIFTFAPEKTVSSHFIEDVLDTVASEGGTVEFIKLICPLAELRSRMDGPSRARYGKLTSLPLFEQLHALGVFNSPPMPEARLTLDTSRLSPDEAASAIARELGIDRAAQPA